MGDGQVSYKGHKNELEQKEDHLKDATNECQWKTNNI